MPFSFRNDIALRNCLTHENGRLKLTNCGQAILLPWTPDLDTIRQVGVTVKTEMLYLGCIITLATVWKKHKYYFFDDDEPRRPDPGELPSVDHLVCGGIIRGCWRGKYFSRQALKERSYALVESIKSWFTLSHNSLKLSTNASFSVLGASCKAKGRL